MSNHQYSIHKFNNEINISRIHTLHYLELEPYYENPGESHSFWEMIYIISGTCTIKTPNGVFKMAHGGMIFHKPGEEHSLTCGKEKCTVFVTSFDCTSRILRYFIGQCITLSEELKPLMKKIISESRIVFSYKAINGEDFSFEVKNDAPIGSEQLIRLYLEEFCILLMQKEFLTFPSPNEQGVPVSNLDSHLIGNVLEYLNKSVYSSLSIEDMCKELHYGRSYIYSCFKEATGYGIHDYYNILKIDEAKKLLKGNKYNIAEISCALNFNSPQYFSKVFKKITQVTPYEYKKSIQKKTAEK